MIDLLNNWSIGWWTYFFPLIIQNTVFLLFIYGVIVYLKKATAILPYSIALLGLIKLLIPAFMPVSWISLSMFSNNNYDIASMINVVIGPISSNQASTQNISIYSILLLVWLIISSIMILLPIISFWRIKHRLRQSVLIETVDNNSGSRIQVFQTDFIALPMTIGIRSKKIYVPKAWENWSKEYRRMAIRHEISHINRHDGLISGIQTLVRALYFFHPLVWILNRRLDELREMVCDELAVDAKGNNAISYSRFLTDVAENMVCTQVDYPTISSLLKKKNELLNRIQYLMEDKMQKPKNITRFLVPTLIFTAFLLSWNCSESYLITAARKDQTATNKLESISLGSLQSGQESKSVTDKIPPFSILTKLAQSPEAPPPPPVQFIESSPDVKFVPYDTPPKPLSPIRPKYPKSAKENGIQGMVLVQAFIDENGVVTKTVILKGKLNSGLEEAAMEAINTVRFSPAKQKDKPVGVWISIPVDFRLDSKTE